MTNSSRSVVLGARVPRLAHRPPTAPHSSAGSEAVELARQSGLVLDDWQCDALAESLAERRDDRWWAFEVGLVVARQNGKGSVLEARQLFGLTLGHEQLAIHTAHEFKTAYEHFLRMERLVDSSPDIRRKVLRIRRGAGEQAIEMRNGCRLRFLARSSGSGRGFSADAVYFDEAYALTPEMHGAALPALSARDNPQVWYTSSAARSDSLVLHALRRRAVEQQGDRLLYLEWSAPDDADPDDPDAWAAANPALGIRIAQEFVEAERHALSVDEFRRERLGIPDPLPATEDELAKLPADRWSATTTATPPDVVPGELVLGYDVHNGVSSVSMASGTLSASYVEIVAHQSGDGWLPARLVELALKWKPTAIGLDSGNGPSAAILGPIREAFEDAGLDPEVLRPLSGRAYRDACGGFFQAVVDGTLRRPVVSPDNLDTAGCKAPERVIGDAFVWDRRRSSVPLAPLVAATVARSLLSEKPTTDKFWFA